MQILKIDVTTCEECGCPVTVIADPSNRSIEYPVGSNRFVHTWGENQYRKKAIDGMLGDATNWHKILSSSVRAGHLGGLN
jgi:hypothetical protein